jgi:hypothetical protein
MFLRVTARLACVALLAFGLGTACGQQGPGDRCDPLSGTDNSGDGDCQSGLSCVQGVGASAGAHICCPPPDTSGAPAECGNGTTPTTDSGTDAAAPLDAVSDVTSDADATPSEASTADADAASDAETSTGEASTADADAAGEASTSDADAATDAPTDG